MIRVECDDRKEGAEILREQGIPDDIKTDNIISDRIEVEYEDAWRVDELKLDEMIASDWPFLT